ncbi:uncharacterized protein ASPGLDRAFT_51876 [Aspergillus glaucus CBS 516.65]|uniref:Uncharacterized protein n=1 Tax=Aspergillus glaucus CBS 516.65 TaxID=1160497 RepID=A0A1L9V8S4_ASPGL|nr:hypothetical protein ASPGLDRAFT_51876 [Aspergillus glaucus CBS 516.65]OJJ80279.1 hypothetical protein ASPGLDRAFT_51876 [Aspergillus glaucus CBS 516.65]
MASCIHRTILKYHSTVGRWCSMGLLPLISIYPGLNSGERAIRKVSRRVPSQIAFRRLDLQSGRSFRINDPSLDVISVGTRQGNA